jgi:hypothetical protein
MQEVRPAAGPERTKRMVRERIQDRWEKQWDSEKTA